MTAAPPRDYDELRDRLIPLGPRLPKRLAQVASFAVERPDEVAFGTAASVAGMAGVQPSTLVRFAQALGYQGFSEMQDVFRARLRDRWPDYAKRLEHLKRQNFEREGEAGLLDGFIKASIASAAHLQDSLDPAVLARATDCLAAAETVYLLGQRRSFPVAAYLGYALGTLRIKAALIDNAGSMAGEQIAFAGSRDALIAVSFSPYSPLTVDLVAKAGARGVPLVAVTDSPFSPIASAARACFEVVESDFGGFRSLSATFCLTMTLAVATAEKRPLAAR